MSLGFGNFTFEEILVANYLFVSLKIVPWKANNWFGKSQDHQTIPKQSLKNPKATIRKSQDLLGNLQCMIWGIGFLASNMPRLN